MNTPIKSNCCNVIAGVQGDTTKFHVCTKCNKACDTHY